MHSHVAVPLHLRRRPMVYAIARYPLFFFTNAHIFAENTSCRYSRIDAKWLTGALAEWWR
jgi:hypothetical protein